MKILAPAGNLDCLKSAVFNGADEVYLGVNQFNARNNIDGFSVEQLKSAVSFAHVYGVKVHLAVNILFSDSEMQSALDLVCDALNCGVDAFIVQDLGLIALINEYYPQAQVHLSTQMGIHNLEGLLNLKKYKFTRVVLARETSLDEIRRIKENFDVEIEYFVQGALCVSFSGNCYMSSYLHGASGNRGKCKQLCRLPYSLLKGGRKIKSGYLLSAKDFNMIDRLNELKKAGVDAIKIEGRARRPFYVAVATRCYYDALNGGKPDFEGLKLAFNRTYTEGYFNGNSDIISDVQNHIGVEVGRVEKTTEGKKFNEIYLRSERLLNAKSTFKFIKDGKQTTLTAYDLKKIDKNLFRITTTQSVPVGAKAMLISDFEREKEVLSDSKRRVIDVKIVAKCNEKITASIKIDEKTAVVEGETLLIAKSSPLTKEQLLDNFNKSEFFAVNLDIAQLEGVFIAKKSLNEFRRKVFDEAFSMLTEVNICAKKVKLPAPKKVEKFSDFDIVKKGCQPFSKHNQIYSPEEYSLERVIEFKNACEVQGKKAYLDISNFATEKDVKIIKEIVEKSKIAVVANNYFALSLSADTVAGGGLNVYNSYSANELNLPVISAESDVGERVNFPVMTLRHCPIKNHVGGDCKNCKFSSDYEYVMENGKRFKLVRKKVQTCTFYLVD